MTSFNRGALRMPNHHLSESWSLNKSLKFQNSNASDRFELRCWFFFTESHNFLRQPKSTIKIAWLASNLQWCKGVDFKWIDFVWWWRFIGENLLLTGSFVLYNNLYLNFGQRSVVFIYDKVLYLVEAHQETSWLNI